MVVRTATVYALVDLNPYAVSRIAPDDPRVAMNIALADFLIHNGEVGERARTRAYQALAKQPLSEMPMLLAAVQALAAGDMKSGEALLIEARHRDPRFAFARLLLLDRYLRTNRTAEAGEEIAILTRLLPQAGEMLLPELARMAARPDTGPTLMRILGRDPKLQQDVLSKLAGSASPEVVLRAAETVPARAGAAPEWQGLLLSRLTGNGDFGRGYALWRRFSGIGGSGGEKNVYDGRFQGLRGGPPFNWQLNASAAGVAERAAGGLQVQYFGRESTELAAQILLLRPGTYTLRVQAEGSASGEGAQLVWSVACAQGNARLVDLPLTKISSAPRALAARFTVPASGCPAQWLRLSGVAADFPGEQDALIREVRIEKAGA
jgi:hypothetical protein